MVLQQLKQKSFRDTLAAGHPALGVGLGCAWFLARRFHSLAGGFFNGTGPFCYGSQGPFLWNMQQAERAKARARMMVNKTRLFMIVSV